MFMALWLKDCQKAADRSASNETTSINSAANSLFSDPLQQRIQAADMS